MFLKDDDFTNGSIFREKAQSFSRRPLCGTTEGQNKNEFLEAFSWILSLIWGTWEGMIEEFVLAKAHWL